LQAELAESVEELTEHKDYWAHWTGFPTLRLDAPDDVEEMRARLRRILSDSNESRLLDLAQDAAELSLTTAEFSRNTMSALPGDPSIDPPICRRSRPSSDSRCRRRAQSE